ncbi:hypothetical protein EVAR_43867_1 [Eumeta japonica]|uniref:Uncharacterized protein n=1 Tax=Eumeta variegata TaxID=151549 RepID=A0A4C1WYU8_EUMVA|nr:hypothetical protein EVAR_43867_1 [Eumeta japonica]
MKDFQRCQAGAGAKICIWSKRVTRWYPSEGKRKRGRPQKRWDDDIRQVAGVMWNRVAQDRNKWKRLEEAFAHWQTDLGKIAKEQILDDIKVVKSPPRQIRFENSDVRERCGPKEDVVARVEKGMSRQFGHLENMNEGRLAKPNRANVCD